MAVCCFVIGPDLAWIEGLRQDLYGSCGTRALVVELSRTPAYYDDMFLSQSLWYSELPHSRAYSEKVAPWSTSSSWVKLFVGQIPITMNRYLVTRVMSYL
eukprot:PhF_6_TR39710/c1_g3_i9/m.59080